MAEFQLTKKAAEDLSNIWEYTFEVWSEKQADNYYELLILSCKEIAKDPDLGKKYRDIAQNIHGLKSNRHIIFYRTISETSVEIIRILHEKMDLKTHLSE